MTCRHGRPNLAAHLPLLCDASRELLAELAALLKQAITLSNAPPAIIAMVSRTFVRETAEARLRDAVR